MLKAIILLALLSAGISSRSERWARPDARDRANSRVIAPAASGAAGCVPVAGNAIDNTWTDFSTDPVTVTLNSVVSPSCSTDGARLQVAAVTDGNFSTLRSVTGVCPNSANNVLSIYVRGHGGVGTGSFDLSRQGDSNTWVVQTFSFTGAWTKFTMNPIVANTTVGRMLVGNAKGLDPGGAESAIDIDVWGYNCI